MKPNYYFFFHNCCLNYTEVLVSVLKLPLPPFFFSCKTTLALTPCPALTFSSFHPQDTIHPPKAHEGCLIQMELQKRLHQTIPPQLPALGHLFFAREMPPSSLELSLSIPWDISTWRGDQAQSGSFYEPVATHFQSIQHILGKAGPNVPSFKCNVIFSPPSLLKKSSGINER